MARLPRIDLPDIPQHVVQRGNNRQPCFLDDQDRACYLDLLHQALQRTGCRLHAYVLMNNHAHLLVTPPGTGAVASLMQQLGRRYVGWFNMRHQRSGTLWEGRYKACLVDSETYVLRCARYIDLNPVRARIVDDPSSYRWSSCAALCGRREDPLLTQHAAQTALSASMPEPGLAYRKLLCEATTGEELQAIREYLKQQRAWGRDDFRRAVEATARRCADVRPAHRPRRRVDGMK